MSLYDKPYDYLLERIKDLELELTAAIAEIATLRRDAERLDWLDTVECGIYHKGYGEYRYYIDGFTKKIRKVIDAAMEKECGK